MDDELTQSAHHFRHKMAPPCPVLAVRGSNGTLLLSGPPSCKEYPSFKRDDGKSRFVAFSKDGTLFGWCCGDKVNVVRVADGTLIQSLDLPKTALLEFSPLGTVLATWQPYTKTQDNPQGEANLQLWELNTGTCLKTFYQKKVQGWCPNWSDDEGIAVRNVNNELHFFENNDFNTIVNKLHLQKVSEFVLSPGPQPSKVAVYVPGSKGAPSFVRLYQYPNFGGPTSALANKSFFKSDRVTMLWNAKATAVLVTASVEVDKTGASYYGEQTLHYLAVSGESAVVQLPKNGPIYDVAWSPSSSEFCVVYGFMPAKATIFNLKCDPVFDFGTGPRNAAFYSPQGHILVLAGFGNLRGQMEVWDVKKYKQVSKPEAPDSTHFSWCPDGEHIVTATCSPRLRVSNGYKIWHYTGTVLHKEDTPEGAELWEVLWQPFPNGTFPEKPIKYQAAPSELGSTEAKPAQAYRPPALRNKPASLSSKLHDDEPPQSLKPSSTGDRQMSKTALKNQKKREAKKASKQEIKSDAPPVQPSPDSTCPSSAPSITPTCGDPETDKKIKNLKKKLKAIEQLKEQQAAGKPLEKNQVEKIQKEAQLLQELEDLELGRREENEDAVCHRTTSKIPNLYLLRRYPDIRIEGENYLPRPIYRHIASFLSLFKLAVIGLIILGKDPFAFFGMQTPGLWVWGQENKIYACMMVFFLSNMIENQCLSTGAFEITLNDVPVWSKLELLLLVGVFTGRETMPMKVCAQGRFTAGAGWMSPVVTHSALGDAPPDMGWGPQNHGDHLNCSPAS
ncbi:hypothetical protein GJAV_G00055910 [Gymnothorax javanicus]|nr:hypothetical protein GJAV_G00055910 [Gymnothorax javanicus]